MIIKQRCDKRKLATNKTNERTSTHKIKYKQIEINIYIETFIRNERARAGECAPIHVHAYCMRFICLEFIEQFILSIRHNNFQRTRLKRANGKNVAIRKSE